MFKYTCVCVCVCTGTRAEHVDLPAARRGRERAAALQHGRQHLGSGQMGSTLMGPLRISCFLTEWGKQVPPGTFGKIQVLTPFVPFRAMGGSTFVMCQNIPRCY